MIPLPRITTFEWVPEFARGFVRDLRPRWAFEEVGQRYEVDLIHGVVQRRVTAEAELTLPGRVTTP